MRQRALESRVREPREAVADLLPRPGQLAGREAGRRLGAGALHRLAQTVLVRARGARRDHRDGPVPAVLQGRTDLVPESEPLADLLEQARIRIGADDLEGEG